MRLRISAVIATTTRRGLFLAGNFLSLARLWSGRSSARSWWVAAAPPHRFAGGGYWEAMHGDMTGWFEVRADGPKPGGGKGRHHYRLYCLLDYEAQGAGKPLLVVVTGLAKPFRTVIDAQEYAKVRQLGREYLARNPRSLA